jgi:hypothetical protein
VQLAQHGHGGETARGGLVRRRQVVQMEDVGPLRTGAREHVDPGSDEPLVGGIVDGGEDAIGRIRAILVRRREGNRRSQRLCKLERRRVVERVDVDPGEEARCVGRLAPPSERARGQRRLPACGRQCARKRARDLSRAAAREEEERRDDAAACRRLATAAPRMVPPPRIACHPHGSILVHRPDAAPLARLLLWEFDRLRAPPRRRAAQPSDPGAAGTIPRPPR